MTDDVSKFLSAPEDIIDNPRELAKALDRKARDAARLQRERASKRKGVPTLEDILSDVVRVAEDEDTNPQAEFRSISKRRYELYGHYPIEYVLEHGTFAHVLQMAGLAQTPTTGRMLKSRTETSLKAHDRRYYTRYIAPHSNKFPELRRATQKAQQVVFISDTHSFFADPFTWNAFLGFITDSQPEIICFGGDLIDGSMISTHPKPPGFGAPLQLELDLFVAQAKEVREACPNARLIHIASNHWTDRMVRHLTQVDPVLSGLRSMRFDQLVPYDEIGMECHMGGSFLAPEGQEEGEGSVRLWDNLLVLTHGTRVGKYPAEAELNVWGTNGVSGHVHRGQIMKGSTNATRHLTWACSPAGVADACAKYYVKSPGPAWQRGFTVINKGRKSLQFTTADTTQNECYVDGFYYDASKRKHPTGVDELKKYWLRRYKLGK